MFNISKLLRTVLIRGFDHFFFFSLILLLENRHFVFDFFFLPTFKMNTNDICSPREHAELKYHQPTVSFDEPILEFVKVI